jgi:hypothetical protein
LTGFIGRRAERYSFKNDMLSLYRGNQVTEQLHLSGLLQGVEKTAAGEVIAYAGFPGGFDPWASPAASWNRLTAALNITDDVRRAAELQHRMEPHQAELSVFRPVMR